jgi:hypothetical protein
MIKDLENKSFNESLAQDDKTKTDSYMYEIDGEVYSDENSDDYNENIYKWLSLGLLIIWFFSLLYL